MVNRRDRGYAILVALGAIVLVTLAVQAAHSQLAVRFDAARTEQREVLAAALLDAGVAATLAELAADPDHAGGRIELGAGSVTTRVRRVAGGWRVAVRAELMGAGRIADAELVAHASAPVVRRWSLRPGWSALGQELVVAHEVE